MDCEIRRNLFHRSMPTPFVTGCDLIGIVVRCPTEGDEGECNTLRDNNIIQVGDRVCAVGLDLGGNAQYVHVSPSHLFRVPSDLDAAQAACLPRTFAAAYQCLHRPGGQRRSVVGKKVLVTGGLGCFGQACVQLARAAGASVVYVTGQRGQGIETRTVAGMKTVELGHDPEEWLPVVGKGVDIVIDTVGYRGYSAAHSALNDTGELICVGNTTYQDENGGFCCGIQGMDDIMKDVNRFNVLHFMPQTIIYDLFEEVEIRRDQYLADLNRLFCMLRDGAIQPPIARCVPLHKVAEAQELIERGGMTGTTVCLPFGLNRPGSLLAIARGNAMALLWGADVADDGVGAIIKAKAKSWSTRSLNAITEGAVRERAASFGGKLSNAGVGTVDYAQERQTHGDSLNDKRSNWGCFHTGVRTINHVQKRPTHSNNLECDQSTDTIKVDTHENRADGDAAASVVIKSRADEFTPHQGDEKNAPQSCEIRDDLEASSVPITLRVSRSEEEFPKTSKSKEKAARLSSGIKNPFQRKGRHQTKSPQSLPGIRVGFFKVLSNKPNQWKRIKE